MTPSRATPGRRAQVALQAGTGACRCGGVHRCRFPRASNAETTALSDGRNGNDEDDVGEHARHIHAFREMDDAVAEPASEAMVSLPMIDNSATVKPMRRPRQNDRQRRRHQHVAEQLIIRGPHRLRRRHQHAVDMAETRDGVEHDRKETDGRAKRDFGGRSQPEEQHIERQEQYDRDRVDSGEQRLEHLGRRKRERLMT